MSHLAVQTVLVSGATGAIGQEICLAAARSGIPFGRIGRPDEVAALVAFLASDEAASMCGSLVEITGAQAVS